MKWRDGVAGAGGTARLHLHHRVEARAVLRLTRHDDAHRLRIDRERPAARAASASSDSIMSNQVVGPIGIAGAGTSRWVIAPDSSGSGP